MQDEDQQGVVNCLQGLVLGSSVQAAVVNGGLHINVPNDAPEDTAAAHHAEVVSLLRAQVRAAQDLPRMLPGSRRPALADVYVRQDLGSSVEPIRSEPPRPTPILDGRGELVEVPGPPAIRIVVRPPVRTVRAVLDDNDHLVVTGGAGQGKSTLSLRLAADIAAHWLDGTPSPLAETVVPLRLTARELAARLDIPFPEALAASVRADYGAMLRTPISADVLCDRASGCRWLLLVDGLDEVADADDKDRLVKVLASWAEESPYRIVLTTRPIEDAVLAPLQRIGSVRYELQPFDDEALRRFIENWFADDESGFAERFLRQIRAAHLDDLVRVPLMATIAAIVFQSRSEMPLPDNEYELYEEYFAVLRSSRPADGPFEPHRAPLLEHLGVVHVETDVPVVAGARDWVRRHMAPEQLPADWPDHLTAFLVAAGPLVIRGNDLTFLHYSFAEHFAATARARQLPTTFVPNRDEFARLLHAARPERLGRFARSVALHYTRLCPTQADPLLRSLHAGGAAQHLLAARLLAKRMPASTPVVDDFLCTVRGWAKTVHGLADDILAHTCRATQHPGISAWLADLMCDESMPWASRTEAAAALAVRLRDEHMAAAIQFLTAVIDDAQIEVVVRLTAAEALSDSGVAERNTAERGLRAVLDDEAGSSTDYRTAAVILAAFDRSAREFAVGALTRRLVDRDTAPGILVEVATGLIEIGPEFHDRAADAFRIVLHDPVHREFERGKAALGLASLGAEGLAEAVVALTDIMTNRRRSRTDRVSAAASLGRLGPQHRLVAGECVRSMLDEPDIGIGDIRYCAGELASFGPTFRDDAEHRLRALIADHGTPAGQVVWALNALGEIGAEHLPEVIRRSWELIDEVRADEDLYISLLGHLAARGEPDRTVAIDELRTHLADVCRAAKSRCAAASCLIDAGPEFHEDVARQVLSIAETSGDPAAVGAAWTELVKLGPRFHDRGLNALLRTAAVEGARPSSWFGPASKFASSEADRDLIADAMIALLTDTGRTYRERLSGMSCVMVLGARFHRRAVRELCMLLTAATHVEFDFPHAARLVANVGIGLREEVANTLCDLMADPRATVSRVHSILAALEILGQTSRPAVLTALRMVIEYGVDPDDRLDAQGALLAVDPSSASMVADDLFPPEADVSPELWQQTVGQLAHLGIDVAARLAALFPHPDVDRRVRWMAAKYWFAAFPEERDFSVAEFERQFADVHYRPRVLAHISYQISFIMPSARNRAVQQIASLVGDERLNISERCASAYEYAHTDRRVTARVLELLGRIAVDSRLTPAERLTAIGWMREVNTGSSVSQSQLAAFAALDSGATSLPASLITALPREHRTRAERWLLRDQTWEIDSRVPQYDDWSDQPLATEVGGAVHEVLTAPEFDHGEQVMAASIMAWDIRSVPAAIAYLDGVAKDSPVARRAQRLLVALGTGRSREVLREAQQTALDTTIPLRVRRKAAETVLAASSRTPESLAGVLREIATDLGTSAQKRAEALLALGRFDGLAPLRALRDNIRTAPGVRRWAADELTEFASEDTEAAAAILAAIAGDLDEIPALRWRAAADLSARGQKGRDMAIELLRAIIRDDCVPVGPRVDAASRLGAIAPTTRDEVLAALRELAWAFRVG